MKLGWFTQQPIQRTQFQQENTAPLYSSEPFGRSLLSEFSKEGYTSRPAVPSFPLTGLVDKIVQRTRDLVSLFTKPIPVTPVFHAIPEQRSWKERVEAYAESPFEKMLLYLRKKVGEYPVSQAWAGGLRSADALTRESALTLLRAFLTYNGADTLMQLSAHTQMKLVLFSSHLSEGSMGKAILYDSLLGLKPALFLDFSQALKKDFQMLPPMAQALVLKKLTQQWRTLEQEEGGRETKEAVALKQLIKSLVVTFYSEKSDVLSTVLQLHDRIRLGHLKIQPVEEAYKNALEEVEKQYRLRLRRLKKARSQKVAQADEERLRRIELVYDTVESDLTSGLQSIDVDLSKLLAAG